MEQVTLSSGELPSSLARDQDDDYYKSDEFRMSSMKVVPCAKRFVHDWTECPFAHPQEKARRRDPKVHSYTGIACPSMKKEGTCAFGDHCPYAHNVFEYWLHPTRYRTQLCNDGSNCRRKICFFAHSLDELRVPACKPFVSPEGLAAAAAAAASDNELKRKAGLVGNPMANLNIPAPTRSSIDSVRQSSEWGPAAMPGAAESISGPSTPQEVSPALDISPTERSEPAADVRFSAHEQQIIEAVTNMLAQDKLSAPQAATILQQMLPSNSLQLLQSTLGFGPGSEEGAGVSRRALSDPVVSLHRQLHGGSGGALEKMGVSSSPRGSMDMGGGRQSMESARSSFDTARFSLDGRRTSSEMFTTPRGSLEYSPAGMHTMAYAPPAPAYPQDRASNDARPPLPPQQQRTSASQQQAAQRYWTSQQLTTVPEGLPMINTPHANNLWGGVTPVRHSTGSMDTRGPTAAANLSSDFHRMSFEEPSASQPQAGQVNPYASSFFSGGGGFGMDQQHQNGEQGSGAGDYVQQQRMSAGW